MPFLRTRQWSETEKPLEGTDTVYATISRTLPADVERPPCR